MADFVTYEELQDYARGIARDLEGALLAWDNDRARTRQSEARTLGMSDLGGCREFIRATVAGDPKSTPTRLKLPAIVGTALGGVLEEAAIQYLEGGARSQGKVTVTLPQSGIQVTGSYDLQIRGSVLVDIKTKDGTDTVKADGPDLSHLIQVSGYLIGLIQSGELPHGSIGVLVYVDRSGRNPEFYAYGITEGDAERYLADADERLKDVAVALRTGEVATYLRDKPESWCWHVQCPFYNQCWGEGYQPTERLHPDEEESVALYARGRDMAKAGENMQREAKARLYTDPEHNVSGFGQRYSIKWVSAVAPRSGAIYDKIDVRELPPDFVPPVQPAEDEAPY